MLACSPPTDLDTRTHFLQLLSRPRRTPRNGEWSGGKAVIFIVTLGATGSVTLAARSAGMSRKSAYALRSRDSAFAQAWTAALAVKPRTAPKGDKAKRAAPSTSSINVPSALAAKHEEMRRDRFFALLSARVRESERLAARPAAQ